MLIVPALTQRSIHYCLLFRPTVSHHFNWLNRNSMFLVTFQLTIVGSFLRLEQDNLTKFVKLRLPPNTNDTIPLCCNRGTVGTVLTPYH